MIAWMALGPAEAVYWLVRAQMLPRKLRTVRIALGPPLAVSRAARGPAKAVYFLVRARVLLTTWMVLGPNEATWPFVSAGGVLLSLRASQTRERDARAGSFQ